MLQHTDAKYDEILTKQCAAPLEAKEDFISANGAFPRIFTQMPYGSYKQWTNDSLLRCDVEGYQPGSDVPMDDLELEDVAYACKPYAKAMAAVDRNRVANELETKGKALMTMAYRNLDVQMATILGTGANFGATYAGVTASPSTAQFIQWNEALSTPIEDVAKYQEEIRAKTGLQPRHMIISKDVFLALRANAEIKAAMRTDADKIVTPLTLARFFDMDEVLVVNSIKNTSKEGATTQTKVATLTKTVLIYHRGSDDILSPACIKIFFNTEYGDQTNGAILETYRDETKKSDIVRFFQDFVFKVTMKELGTLLTAVIA